MYNRYLQNSCPPPEPPACSKPKPCRDTEHSTESGGLLSSLTGLLGGEKGGLSKLLDDNTWIIFVILFFLLKDDDNGVDHDLLLLAGLFLLIGL